MIYNVNFNLENHVRSANNEAALKDAILAITSSLVTDMQNTDARRERADKKLAGEINALTHQVDILRAEGDQLRRRL